MTLGSQRKQRIPLTPTRTAARALALALSLASLGSSTPAAPPGGSPAPLLNDYVGLFRVEAPGTQEFLLHGTLPLPPGIWTDPNTTNPLVVIDHDGTPLTTQTEVVARYPATADGISVAEVLARVHRPSSAAPGTQLIYGVKYSPSTVAAPPAASVGALLNGVLDVPQSVKTLIQNPNGFVVETLDCFGNRYATSLLGSGATVELLKHGPLFSEIKVSTVLKPSPAVSGAQGTLPHMMGVNAYISVRSEEEYVGVDLRFHNAHSGKSTATTDDDPLGTIYFQSISLNVPNVWSIAQDYLDPFLGAPKILDAATHTYPLVVKPAGGKLHPMKWQQQFHRRLALTPPQKWWHAQEKARGAGVAFATRGSSPTSGQPLWSWWNPATARWFPQSQRLPSLDHMTPGSVKQSVKALYDDLYGHLVYGYGDGVYPIEVGVLGYAHPYGISYAGMTSGSEIYLVDGNNTLETAAQTGYQLYRMAHRMHSDRMPNVLYDADGTPSTVEEWKFIGAGGEPYLPFQHFHLPQLSSQDPFGLWLAPTFQQNHVAANDLMASWGNDLLAFEPHDFQHYIRYTRSAKVLTWMANDSLARDDLRMQAEMFHHSYHEYNNSYDGYVQVSGLKYDQEYVAGSPHQGLTYGRGEAWGLDAALAAYATSSPAWRAENRPWIDKTIDVIAAGQMTCTGFIQAQLNEHFADGNYRSRQIVEQSIIENALVGAIESVYRNVSSAYTAKTKDTLRASLYSMLDPMSWAPGQNAPWATSAVGPLHDSAPIYCDISEVPLDGHSSYTDGFQNWSSFGYGFQETYDLVFLEFAELQMGTELLSGLLADGIKNIENRAALIALIESLAGMP